MKKKIRYSTIPISIAQSFVLLAFFLWVHAFQMMKQCPTESDSLHTVQFNNHGTIHYLSHKEIFAQRAAIGIALTGGAFTLTSLAFLSKRTGIPMSDLFKQIKLFRTIEIETNKETEST